MTERFVKSMKEDYFTFMPKPEMRTALQNLAAAFTHYSENPPVQRAGISLLERIKAEAGIVNLSYTSDPQIAAQDQYKFYVHLLGQSYLLR